MFYPGVSLRPLVLGLFLVPGLALFTVQTGFAQQPNAQAYFELLAQAEAKTSAKQWADAAALWEKAISLNPTEGRSWDRLSEARYNLKDYRKVIAANEKVIELGYGSPATASYIIASNYALLGETEQALRWLEKAFKLGFRDFRQAQTNPNLKSLRNDPRYQKLVALVDVSKMSRTQGWRFDLQLLAREVKRMAHSSFRGAKEEDFDASVKKLRGEIPRLTDAQIIVELAKLMRKVGDGHSGIFFSGEREELRQTLPVLFYLFEEGLFVIAADPKYKDLLGAQVLRFGDRTVAEVVQALDPLISRDASTMWVKTAAPYRMRHLPLLHALGLIPDAQKVPLVIRGADGTERTVTLAADASQPNIWNMKPNPPTWVNLPQTLAAPLPLYLKNPAARFWFEYLPDNKTVYFQFNSVRNDQRESLAAFSERLFKFVNENEVEKLVIDLRWNNGGNIELLRPLIHGLIKNEKVNRRGRLFVIIGRRVFSAAQNAATFFERHTNAIFVGEPTGSSPNFVGEEDPFTLPYSKLVANVSHVEYKNSYVDDSRIWIAPQIHVPPTFAAYRANRDPALEAILNYRNN